MDRDPAQNGVNLTLSVGTHTYTLYAENANAYSWNNYTLNLHFDNSNSAQVSVLAPLNSNSTQFFPPSASERRIHGRPAGPLGEGSQYTRVQGRRDYRESHRLPYLGAISIQ